MGRVQSRAAAPGGVGRARGGGWRAVRRLLTAAACAAAVAGGTGCVTANKSMAVLKEAVGMGPAKPATVLVAVFQPRIEYLADPTQDATLRPGIVGQVFLYAADGQFTEVNGDLVVFAEDVTPRPAGMPKAVSEAWHFDKNTLRKLRTKDEHFGNKYVVFLPYPSNWKDVTQIQLSCKYEPKPEAGETAGPTLTNSPQVLPLDFTPPGQGGPLKITSATTHPAEVKAIPDVGKMIAQGRTGAPTAGPQPALNPAAQHAAATMPTLPPPTDMTRTSFVSTPGPNGSTVQTSAVVLPPGQTLPPGWTVTADRKMVPPGWTVGTKGELVPPAGTANPLAVQPPVTQPPPMTPPANVAPPSVGIPLGSLPTNSAPINYQPPPANYPPPAYVPPAAPTVAPPPSPSAPMPAIPMPGAAAGFDPNSTTGSWANTADQGNRPAPPGGSSLPPVNLPGGPPPTVAPPPSGGPSTLTIPRR
ncbi:MAG: hypothetical protein ABGY75_22975 [Gemmataceae bacterium]